MSGSILKVSANSRAHRGNRVKITESFQRRYFNAENDGPAYPFDWEQRRQQDHASKFLAKRGRVPVCWNNGKDFRAHIESPAYSQSAIMNYSEAIGRAFRLEARLGIVPHHPACPEMAFEGTSVGLAARKESILRIWDTGASQGMNDLSVTPREKIFEKYRHLYERSRPFVRNFLESRRDEIVPDDLDMATMMVISTVEMSIATRGSNAQE